MYFQSKKLALRSKRIDTSIVPLSDLFLVRNSWIRTKLFIKKNKTKKIRCWRVEEENDKYLRCFFFMSINCNKLIQTNQSIQLLSARNVSLHVIEINIIQRNISFRMSILMNQPARHVISSEVHRYSYFYVNFQTDASIIITSISSIIKTN